MATKLNMIFCQYGTQKKKDGRSYLSAIFIIIIIDVLPFFSYLLNAECDPCFEGMEKRCFIQQFMFVPQACGLFVCWPGLDM